MTLPAISILMIVGRQRERAAATLASVLAQDRIDEAEVIVADVAWDECPPVAGSDQPAVRVLRAGRGRHIGQLRAEAIRFARAPLVAFLEEHAVALPGWLAGTLDAFAQGPWSVVGPVIRLGKDDSPLSLALACLSFGAWIAPTSTREIASVIGHDSAYRREALRCFAEELDELLVAEPVLHGRLVERGEKILLSAAAEIYHRNESTVTAMLFDYFHCNITFGALGLRGKSMADRLLRLAATPVVPFLRTWRAWPTLRKHIRGAALLQATAYTFLCSVAQAAGLVMGYLGWTQGAAMRLSRVELESPDRHRLPKEYV